MLVPALVVAASCGRTGLLTDGLVSGMGAIDDGGGSDGGGGAAGPLPGDSSSPFSGPDATSVGPDAPPGDSSSPFARPDAPSVGPDAPPDVNGEEAGAPGTACNASTCNGCCEGNMCVTQITPLQCGSYGQPCVVCPPGDICRGECAGPVANCGPLNCPGCCIGPNVCSTGTFDVACGSGGQQCSHCGPNEGTDHCIANASGPGGACSIQQCNAQSCANGCCSNGVCLGGQSPGACGNHGDPCQVCGPGEACIVQQCMTGTPCGPENCAGCCGGTYGNDCVAGQVDNSCGIGGAVCQNCMTFDQSCVNGACVIPIACTTANCKGCCYGNICAEGDQPFLCGTGGVPCGDCQRGGFQCIDGACR